MNAGQWRLGARNWEHVAPESSIATAPHSDPTGSGHAGPTVRGPASLVVVGNGMAGAHVVKDDSTPVLCPRSSG